MNKFFLRFWKHFNIRNIGKVIQYVVIYSFVFIPCLFNAAPSPQRSNVVISVVENPDILKACVPRFEHVGVSAVPPNIIAKNNEPVGEGSSGSGVSTVQVDGKSGNDAKECTNKAGKKITVGHLCLVAPFIFFGGLFAVFLLYLILIGDLDFIFPRGWLRRLRVPKCLYHDDL